MVTRWVRSPPRHAHVIPCPLRFEFLPWPTVTSHELDLNLKGQQWGGQPRQPTSHEHSFAGRVRRCQRAIVRLETAHYHYIPLAGPPKRGVTDMARISQWRVPARTWVQLGAPDGAPTRLSRPALGPSWARRWLMFGELPKNGQPPLA
jgi:hypothetical protein